MKKSLVLLFLTCIKNSLNIHFEDAISFLTSRVALEMFIF